MGAVNEVQARRGPMLAGGLWTDEPLDRILTTSTAERGDHVGVVAHRSRDDSTVHLTWQKVADVSGAMAQQLAGLGVEPGDVVSYQLPNWWEFVAVSFACAQLGAIANPLMPILRRREVDFIVGHSDTRALITPAVWRGFDHAEMGAAVCADHDVPHLVVGDESPDELVARFADAALIDLPGLAPDDTALLMYTSGTTGTPKGVMHTSNTLRAQADSFIERLELDPSAVFLGASPTAHLTGYAYLMLVPAALGATTVLQDQWNPEVAHRLCRDHGVTFSMGATPFVADLCASTENGTDCAPTLTRFVCAGAPIPPPLIERADRILGVTVSSAWGMTENGAATITPTADALERSDSTDGRPVRGVEIRVVDDDGAEVASGRTGNLQIRGATQAVGYFKRPDLDPTGDWFDTGDLAWITDDGWVRIAGRTKDIIIRGGENVPVVEVENLLYRHDRIVEVAIVGRPDERLGERACAFAVLSDGPPIDLGDLTGFLEAHDVARQFLPEELIVVDEMPKTPSGKIQKFALRDQLA